MPMQVIATDSGLVRSPIPVSSFRHGMAERYEVVVDFSRLAPGTQVTLLNTNRDDEMRDVLRFVVGTATGPARPLAAVPQRPGPGALPTARVGWSANAGSASTAPAVCGPSNGLPWEERLIAAPRANTTERWIFRNNSGGWFHPVHVHLVDFLIARRNGGAALPYERGLKDTAYVGPNERLELLMTFKPAPRIDPARPVLGKYVMHCHNLIHEDHDMMTELDVRPGNAPARAAHGGHMAPSMMVQGDPRE